MGKTGELTDEKSSINVWKERGKRRGLRVNKRGYLSTAKNSCSPAPSLPTNPAAICAQALRTLHTTLGIQFFLNFNNVLTHMGVAINFFFNLFDRVDGGGVVFSTELVRNFWKTKMQLTT